MRVCVTGWSVHVPGLPTGLDLAGWTPPPACPPESAAALLGRKGLLATEPATRLALCAVHRALGLPAGTRPAAGDPPEPMTAVVGSSNLGSAAAVCTVAAAARDGGVRAVSPLDAPNVASNVIASTVAIWFGFGGPNLMICSGHPSGLDAIGFGGLLLASGRAQRVVVVGAEPADDAARILFATGSPRQPQLRQAAACVLLEPSGGPGTVAVGPVQSINGDGLPPEPPETLLVAPAQLAPRRRVVDLTARLGSTYGALGVLQVAVAAAILSRRGGTARVGCGDRADGYRTIRLEAS